MPRKSRPCKSGLIKYKTVTKNGKKRARCLSDMCKRSKNSDLWFPRDNEGKCGRLEDIFPGDYREYRLAQRRKNYKK